MELKKACRRLADASCGESTNESVAVHSDSAHIAEDRTALLQAHTLIYLSIYVLYRYSQT